MDRHRFQVGIGTMMVAVGALAGLMAIARVFGVLMTGSLLAVAARLVAYVHVRTRCKAEGRRYTAADDDRVQALTLKIGLPISAVIAILLFLLFPSRPPRK